MNLLEASIEEEEANEQVIVVIFALAVFLEFFFG